MKASELRIGNFIFGIYENNNDQMCKQVVRFLGYDPFENYFWVDGDIEIESYDRFEPIPLTEEWLVKFGFVVVHKDNRHYCINDPNGFKDAHKISIFPTVNDQWHIVFSDTLAEYKYYIPTTKIKYVHQLQNLYFALTGEELELKEVKP